MLLLLLLLRAPLPLGSAGSVGLLDGWIERGVERVVVGSGGGGGER